MLRAFWLLAGLLFLVALVVLGMMVLSVIHGATRDIVDAVR